VTLAYRGEAFGRVKQKNRQRLEGAQRANRLAVLTRSSVARIAESTVILRHDTDAVTLKNDAVIVCAGGILPAPMLKETGVIVETKFGSA